MMETLFMFMAHAFAIWLLAFGIIALVAMSAITISIAVDMWRNW